MYNLREKIRISETSSLCLKQDFSDPKVIYHDILCRRVKSVLKDLGFQNKESKSKRHLDT